MLVYQAPVASWSLLIEAILATEPARAWVSATGFDADLVPAVLDEHAKLSNSLIADCYREGDHTPPQWQAGAVTMPAGFHRAFQAYQAGGWQGLHHPETWGGQGLPHLLSAACSEFCNAANLAFALCPLLTDGAIEALRLAGSAEQQAQYIPKLISGEWTGTMNLTEPQAGSDLAAITSMATPQPDGRYRLRGQKIYITYGEHDLAKNIIHLVLARTPGAPAGVKGLSLFVVPKFLVRDDGSLGERNDVYCASIEHKLGIHGSPTAVMLYGEGLAASEDSGQAPGAWAYRVGAEGEGLALMFIMMNAARFAVGVQGLAVAERAYQAAMAYAQQRVQGRPIHEFPDVQRMLHTQHALIAAMRVLVAMAAAERDASEHLPDEMARQLARQRFEYLVPQVKAWCTEQAQTVVTLALQVFGGMGYIEDTGIAQLFRDARILTIYEGTTAIQANDFIGRKLFKHQAEIVRLSLADAERLGQKDGIQHSIAARWHQQVLDLQTKSVSTAVMQYHGYSLIEFAALAQAEMGLRQMILHCRQQASTTPASQWWQEAWGHFQGLLAPRVATLEVLISSV